MTPRTNARGADRARCGPAVSSLVALLVLLTSPAPHADDSELFLGDRDAVAAPANVLFIIDTSGSMDTELLTQAPWDPAENFSGCYRSDAIYFSTNGNQPACDSDAYLPKSANFCAEASTQFRRIGYFSDFALSWNEAARRWERLDAAERDRPLECDADRGVHGNGSGPERFAADGSEVPWATDSAQEPSFDTSYLLFDGNWLNWKSDPPTVRRTRLEVVQDAVNRLNQSLRDVRVGVMRFNRSEGGAVVQAVTDIETSRTQVEDVVNALRPNGSTPLSETLYEASQYFMGRTVDYGDQDDPRSVAAARVGNRIDGDTYRSPVDTACGKNYIVLLTDGEPTRDRDADDKITSLPGFATLVSADCDGSGDGRCLDDLAAYLFTHDLDPDAPGLQNVITHTIGFDLDLPLLSSTANRGGGEYFLADDTATLTTALAGIITSIFDNSGVLAAPTVPVNAFNRTQNLSDVFVSVFQPSDRARWTGNLKKYRFDNGQLVGRNGRPAIDATTGLFASDAVSFWSSSADGSRVGAGGAASRLPDYTTRRLFTDIAGTALSGASNRVGTANGLISAALVGAPVAERDAVIQWALGRDVRDVDGDGDTAETRRDMGDPFHVQPVTVVYGGEPDDPIANVFVATNDGFLHAINARNGNEQWAYIPSPLLPRLYGLYLNQTSPTKQYGLDGQPRLVVLNDDGVPGFTGSEQAILVFGMGRGGSGIFAVDVTRPNTPVLLWQIDASDSEFADLGETWSTPVPVRIRVGSDVIPAVAFGGGYDSGQDSDRYRTDSVGNSLYLIDVRTGERIWSAGGPDSPVSHDLTLDAMTHSIPASPRALDLTGDGLTDRLYVGDMGGRVWRFDIVNGNAGASLVEGGVLASLGAADLGASPDSDTVRRFYATPDVVPIRIGNRRVLAVNIGSGYRGHPLDTAIDEAFFSIHDQNGFGVIETAAYGAPITIDQLEDVTSRNQAVLPAGSPGWVIKLNQGAGEKVLGDAVTVNATTFFTSFEPGAPASDCASGVGVNRLYAVSIFDGSARTNFDFTVDPDNLTIEDRSRELTGGNPITDVGVFQPVGSEPSVMVCAGVDCLGADELGNDGRGLPLLGRPVRRTFWFEAEE